MSTFTKRVIVAVLSLEDRVVYWPSTEERLEISRRIETETGFPHCIGFVDGTLIPVERKPTWHGEDFFSHKHRYGINALIVCDDKMRIRMCYTGWAGSSHDARVFSQSP